MMRGIFYGAGHNAKENISRWISEGCEPVCFCDKNPQFHHTNFLGHEVLSLNEARRKYPNLPIYMTVHINSVLAVRDYLLKENIPQEMILHPDYEYRMGCNAIQFCIRGLGKGYAVGVCCGTPKEKLRFNVFDVNSAVAQYKETVDRIFREQRGGGLCDRCNMLYLGYFSNNNDIRQINIGSSFKDDKCPLRCVYCNSNHRSEIKGLVCDHTAFDTLSALSQNQAVQKCERIAIDNLEPFLMPHFDDFLDIVNSRNWYLEIMTTGLVYNRKIADMSQRVQLIISLDSGTEKTYFNIKKQHSFEIVRRNIAKYAELGIDVRLKYIILHGLNDNERDVHGFLDIAKKNRLSVILARDINIMSERMNESEKNTYEYFCDTAKEMQIEFFIATGTFSADEMKAPG